MSGSTVEFVVGPRRLCEGKTKQGLPCSQSVCRTDLSKPAFCRLHKWQEDGSEEHKHICDGITQKGRRCQSIISNKDYPRLKPCFCHRHRRQAYLHKKYVACFGKTASYERCHRYISWEAPYFQFCELHQNQVNTMSTAIAQVSIDVLSMVTDYLHPGDRVSFALASSGCANFLRSWGAREHMPRDPTVLFARTGVDLSDGRILSYEHNTWDGTTRRRIRPEPFWPVVGPSVSVPSEQPPLLSVHTYLPWTPPNAYGPLIDAAKRFPHLFDSARGLSRVCMLCQAEIMQGRKDVKEGDRRFVAIAPYILCTKCQSWKIYLELPPGSTMVDSDVTLLMMVRWWWRTQPVWTFEPMVQT